MVDGYLSIEDLKKVEMVVGLVVAAKNAENSEKLIRLELDLGEEKRRVIFTGVRLLGFEADWFVGRKLLVVANLEPRKMINDEYSQGMLLAVDGSDGKPVFLEVGDGVEVGSKVR